MRMVVRSSGWMVRQGLRITDQRSEGRKVGSALNECGGVGGALTIPQAVIAATGGEQRLVAASLDDATGVEDHDLVDGREAREAMGDQQRGPAPGRVEQ